MHRDSEEATPDKVIDKCGRRFLLCIVWFLAASAKTVVSGRLQRVEKAFANVFGIIVLPVPRHPELRLQLVQTPIRAKIFTGEVERG